MRPFILSTVGRDVVRLMKDKRKYLAFLPILMIVIASLIYNRINLELYNEQENEIIVDIGKEDQGLINLDTEDDLIISEQDATNLVLEQVDYREFNISILKGVKDLEGNRYYLFDLINKSGPSFATKIAVNIRSGEILGYEPDKDLLIPMTDFPIETPLGQVQDWNGSFVISDLEASEEPIYLDLYQGDENSFEFYFRLEDQEEPLMFGVAQVSGASANYKDGENLELIFTKEDRLVKVRELDLAPIEDERMILSGEYTKVD